MLLAAAGLFVASFLVAAPSTTVVGQQTLGPISTVPLFPNHVSIPGSEPQGTSQAVDIQLSFRADQLIPGETLFHVGAPASGISAVVSVPARGAQSVLLTAQDPLHPFSAVLVNDATEGRDYTLAISIPNDHEINASAGGQPQFSYSHLGASLLPQLEGANVGSGPLGTSPFRGAISNFLLSLATTRETGSADLIVLLRVLSLLLFACAVALGVIRFVTGATVGAWLKLPGRAEPQARTGLKILKRHSTLVAVVLLGAAIATLDVVTPIDNVVLKQNGTQNLTAAPVGPNESSFYPLYGETRLIDQARATDIDLSFDIERTVSVSNPPQGAPFVISTFGDNQGLKFQVVETKGLWQLISFVGGHGSLLPATQRLLIAQMPLGEVFRVRAVVQRSQSFRYYVDGDPVQTFTWNLPIINASPAALSVNGSFGGFVRNLTMTVNLYQADPNRVPYFLIRLGQLLALLAVIASAVILCRRFLSRLIPRAAPRRPLVIVTFSTMGAATVLNIVIDLLHFQQSNNLYASRNSWLLSQYPRFNDFFQIYELLRSFNPYGIQSGNYPPLGYWIVAPFAWMNEYAALIAFIGLMVGFIVWWAYQCFTAGFSLTGRVLVIAVVLLSLPVSVAVDRANEDLVLFVFIVLGIAALERLRPAVAAAWIGIAAAAKVYPVVFLMVFLRGRRVRYIFLGVAIAAAISLVGFASFHLSFVQNVDGFKKAYAATNTQTQAAGGVMATYYNASIPAWVQSIGFAINGNAGLESVRSAIFPAILPVEALVALALAAYLRWREQSLWRAVTLITTFVLLFSDLSYYYELLFLLVGLALFVKYAEVTRNHLIIAVLFGLSMAPRAYFYFGSTMIDASVLTTAPLLIGLTVAVLYDGHRSRVSAATLDNDEVLLTLPPLSSIDA